MDGVYSGKIFDTNLSIAAAIYIQWRIIGLGLCVTVILSHSSGADFQDCQRQHIREIKERETRNQIIILRTELYEPTSRTTDRNYQWRSFGRLGARESPPPLVGGQTHADTIYIGPRSNQKRRVGNEETKFNETSKLLPCPPYLRPRLYTPTTMADLDSLGETCQPGLGCFHDVPQAPSWCVCGCNRPIG